MYHLRSFSIFHTCEITTTFKIMNIPITPQNLPPNSSPHPIVLSQSLICFLFLKIACSTVFIQMESLQYVLSLVWLLSHSIIILRLIHIVACISGSFFCRAAAVVQIDHSLFVYSPVDQQLSCFQFLAITNRVAINVCV